MKNCALLLVLLFLFNCTSDDNSPKGDVELFGKWKLIEQYTDPGDGSGDFSSISSNRTVEFFSNGTIVANGILCYMSSEVGENNSGTFKLISSNETDTNHDGEILPNDCEFSETKIYFDINSNNKLVLWYQCIEGCGQKFEKI